MIIKSFVKKVKQDINNFNINNSSEKKVIDANYVSAYKNTIVVKLPIGQAGASFGVMVIGKKVKDPRLVKHEYGHRLQLRNMGAMKYLMRVAIPSVTANLLQRMGKLPYDYYGSPWEAGADRLAGVQRKRNHEPWPDEVCGSYGELIRMFWKKNK